MNADDLHAVAQAKLKQIGIIVSQPPSKEGERLVWTAIGVGGGRFVIRYFEEQPDHLVTISHEDGRVFHANGATAVDAFTVAVANWSTKTGEGKMGRPNPQ